MASWGSSGSQAPPGFSMTQDDDEEEFDPTKPKKKRAVKQSVTVEKKLVIKSAERTAAQRKLLVQSLLDESSSTLNFRVEGLEPRVTVRESCTFDIHGADEEGVAVPTANLAFTVSIRGVALAHAHFVAGDDPEVYSAEWKPPNSGNYSISISFAGRALPGSPFQVFASTPEPCPTKCVLKGKALTLATARDPQAFEVQFRDPLGATTHAVELDVFVEPVGMNSPRGRGGSESGDDEEAALAEAQGSKKKSPKKESGGGKKGKKSAEVGSPSSSPLAKAAGGLLGALAAAIGGGGGSDDDDLLGPEPVETERTPLGRKRRETRYRKIRVRVLDKPLIVRAGPELNSSQLGQLLPGAVVTVTEERIDRANGGTVRACISLDSIEKQDSEGVRYEKGLTFRSALSNRTFRASDTAAAVPEILTGGTAPPCTAIVLAGAPSAENSFSQRGKKGSAARSTTVVASVLPAVPEVSAEGGWLSGALNAIEGATGLDLDGDGKVGAGESATGASAPLAVEVPPDAESTAGQEASTFRQHIDSIAPLPLSCESFEPPSSASHAKILKRLPLKLSTDYLSTDQRYALEKAEASQSSSRKSGKRSHRGGGKKVQRKYDGKASVEQVQAVTAAASSSSRLVSEISATEGWVTLMKSGDKFVSSRLRLDVHERNLHGVQWERRSLNTRLTKQEYDKIRDTGKHVEASERTPLGPSLARQVALELDADPSSFAYGGTFPGNLHSHGQLKETHQVKYSIGVAGSYLLHVRLLPGRRAAGSPFLLQVNPGLAYALFRLPFEPWTARSASRSFTTCSAPTALATRAAAVARRSSSGDERAREEGGRRGELRGQWGRHVYASMVHDKARRVQCGRQARR